MHSIDCLVSVPMPPQLAILCPEWVEGERPAYATLWASQGAIQRHIKHVLKVQAEAAMTPEQNA